MRAQPDGLRLRIGVHQGEVVPEGEDLLGDGVIVAARLEPLAEPGGICISARVREDASGKMALEVDDLGEPALKNIAARIRVFRVRLGAADGVVNPPALPLPDKPSIAVLAFTNMSGDLEQEYFSDEMAEDIITQLSRSRALFVMARNSSFTYKGRAVNVAQVGRELGVRYVLEGSVRRGGERVRISAQLVEAETGNHVWAERYDRALADVFAVQDEISHAVATAIGSAVAGAEIHRALRRPPGSLGAWELYQQAMWHLGKADAASNDEARHLFERAIEHDPMFAAAYTGLSRAYGRAAVTYLTMPQDEAVPLEITHARKAVELDPGDAEAQSELATALRMRGDMDESEAVVRHALSINPNCAPAHWNLGMSLISAGRTAEGRQAFVVFERLSPRDVSMPVARDWTAISYYFDHDYESCIAAARRVVSAYPGFTMTSYRFMAAALGQLGRIEEARAALEKAIAMSPRMLDVVVRNRLPFFRPEDHEHMVEGLRKAGWQG